jgi:hypothetical protein
MDKQFSTLVASDLAPPVDRFLLSIVHRRRTLSTSRFYCPSVGVRNYALMALSHFSFLLF